VIFFLVVSAGFYTVQQATNSFILIALSGLVGMFGNEAAEKLKKIAEGLLSEVPKDNIVESDTVSIASIEPQSGSIDGKTDVTITGQNFDDVIVRFGEKDATFKRWSQTSITVITPEHTAGNVDVFVINKNGQSFVIRKGYTYVTTKTNERPATSPSRRRF
jgi:hypothetical protein